MSKCKFRKGCQRQGKIFLSVGFCTEPEQTPLFSSPWGEARVSDTAGRLSRPVGIVLLVILSKEKKVLFLRLKSMSC